MSEISCTDFNDYQTKALRTLNLIGHEENMLHAIMGMMGEAGEFAELPYEQREKRIGEIGDCLWYAAVLSSELGYNFQFIVDAAYNSVHTVSDLANHTSETRALLWGCRMVDLMKKTVFYGKELDKNKLRGMLINYVEALLSMASKTGVLLLDAGTINIRKLAARYPDLVFDADKAINRNYAVESSAAGVEIS